MLNSFILSYKIKNTYRVNSIIYSLKNIPIIKKIIPVSLYKNKGLKIFANVISTIVEFFSVFLGKLLYLLFMIYLFLPLYYNTSLAIINIFFFFNISRGLI